MALPFFSDIGKQAKDLFEKNFYFGCVKLDVKNQLTDSMTCTGSHRFSLGDGNISGELQGKFDYSGFTISPKVTTDAVISSEIKLDNLKSNGFNLNATCVYNAHEKKKSTNMGICFKYPDYNLEFTSIYNDPMVKADGFALRSSGVINLFGWLFGASLISDPSSYKIMHSNFIGGFQDGRFAFFVNFDPQHKQVAGSVFNLVNDSIQTGLVYSLGGHEGQDSGGQPNLAFCSNYILNGGATLKARINTDYMVGLSYILTIKNGINLTMCTEIDGKKIKQGGHKLGLGLEFS